MPSHRTMIRSLLAAGALALGARMIDLPSTTPLGNGFTLESPLGLSFPAASRPHPRLWLTRPDTTRIQLSDDPVARHVAVPTHTLVVWQESRFLERNVLQDIHTAVLLAADANGRRTDLTPWLMERAKSVLPTASPESLAAILGSSPEAAAPTHGSGSNGVRDFTPIAVELAPWRPGITVWCTVPCNGAYRPLAMRVDPEEIEARLRSHGTTEPHPVTQPKAPHHPPTRRGSP